MAFYEANPVIETLDRQGTRLAEGFVEASARHGLSDHVKPIGFPCNLLFATTDPDGSPSQSYRSLFLQETIRRGVIMPSLVVSYSHDDAAVDATIAAIDGALGVYAKAMEDGADAFLDGRPSRAVFERRWRT